MPTTDPNAPTQGSFGSSQTAQQGVMQQATQAPSLPPTGLQQQLGSLSQLYGQVQQAPGGFNVAQAQMAGGQQALPQQQGTTGGSLNQLARNLAQNYGLSIGNQNLVDAAGNFLMTPEQIVASSGGQETLGTASAKMNMIADAIANRQTQQAQMQGRAASQAGIQLVQDRGRGSLATLQQGAYQHLADMYANQQFEAADFNFWIQKEQQDIQMELMRKQEKMQKRQGWASTIVGAAGLIAAPFTGGATLGIGLQGLSQGYASGAWF